MLSWSLNNFGKFTFFWLPIRQVGLHSAELDRTRAFGGFTSMFPHQQQTGAPALG